MLLGGFESITMNPNVCVGTDPALDPVPGDVWRKGRFARLIQTVNTSHVTYTRMRLHSTKRITVTLAQWLSWADVAIKSHCS